MLQISAQDLKQSCACFVLPDLTSGWQAQEEGSDDPQTSSETNAECQLNQWDLVFHFGSWYFCYVILNLKGWKWTKCSPWFMMTRMKSCQFISSAFWHLSLLWNLYRPQRPGLAPDKQSHCLPLLCGGQTNFFCIKVEPNIWPSSHTVTNQGSPVWLKI